MRSLQSKKASWSSSNVLARIKPPQNSPSGACKIPFADGERRDILEIMEDRYGARSTIITTQFPIDIWHDIIGDPTLADAICDRVIHNAHKIILKPGEESMRKIHSTLTEGRTLL